MSRKIKVLKLGIHDKELLERGYKHSSKASYSRRCHIILLKSKGKTSKEIADIFDIDYQSVNNWVKRFEAKGLDGLVTKKGQGRSPIFDKTADAEKVKNIVKKRTSAFKISKRRIDQRIR